MRPLNYNTILISIGVWVFLASSPLCAQEEKVEVEKGIEFHEMPDRAQSLLNEHKSAFSKEKYYRETGGEDVHFEAKIDWNGYRYSIEFDEEGIPIDIEQLIEFNEIPRTPRKKIKQ